MQGTSVLREMPPSWLSHMKACDLTLNCMTYPALPLVHEGDLTKKTIFPPVFFDYFYTIYTLITTIFQKKKKKKDICTISDCLKMAAK